MSLDPLQALQAANRAAPPVAATAFGTLLIAGATGALGQELLRRLAGSHRFAHARVLAREPIRDGLRGVETCLSPALPIAQWPLTSADTAVIAFDPPRLYHDRERALWVPEPSDCLRSRAGCAPAACRRWPSCSRTTRAGCPRR
jgi:hypothetical protein